MQFIEGETFDAFVKRRGPLPAPLALHLIVQAAQGLAAASTRGLIHRDIKPANLMLVHPEADPGSAMDADPPDDEEMLVKVIDFGLAKYLNKPGETTEASLTGDRIVGTPYYMSPEQIDPAGKEIDARADIYSLGVTLWHLLAGNPPFRGTEFQVFNQHMNHSLPWEQLPAAVPAQVHDLLERMMAKNPADRPASHRELVGLLKQQLRAMGAGGLPLAGTGSGPRQDVIEQSAEAPLSPPDFSLAEVVARRERLTTREVLGLLSLLAPLVDAKREGEGQAYDLTPERIFVRFDSPPAKAADLLAQPLDAWPPSQLEIITLGGSGDAAVGHPARALGELTYALLAGHAAVEESYEPVPTVNARGNAVLRQVLEATDSFGTAVRFAEAFRLSLAGELHVPVMPAPAVSATASSRGSDAWEYSPNGVTRAATQRKKRSFPGRLVFVLVAGAVTVGSWWLLSGGKGGSALEPMAAVPDAVQAAPAGVVPKPVVAPAGEPVPGSITTRAVRRYAPPPFYPPAAKAARQHGTVLLNVDVDATGVVTGVSVKQSSGFPLLDDAAMQAMRVWKFDPARTNEVAVPSRTEQPVEFKVPGT